MHFPIFAATRRALDIEPYSNRAHCQLSIPHMFCVLTRYIGRAAEAQSRGSMHMLTNMHRHAHHPSSAATRRALEIGAVFEKSALSAFHTHIWFAFSLDILAEQSRLKVGGSMHMLTNMHRRAHHPSTAATRRALDIEPYSKRAHRQLSYHIWFAF